MTFQQCEYKEVCKFYEHEALCCIYPIVSKFCRYKKHYDIMKNVTTANMLEQIHFIPEGIEECLEDKVLFKREDKQ